MAGHISKYDKGKWLITVEAGKDPASGKRKRIKRVFEGTKPEAKRELSRLILEAQKGTFLDTTKITLGEFLSSWLKDYGSARLAPTTQRRYAQIINLRIIPKLGQVPLKDLKPLHIQKFYRELSEEGKLDGTGPLSHASIIYHHRVLHKALDSALKQQLILNNPADAVEIPKPLTMIDDPEDIEIKILNNDQIKHLLSKAKDTPYYELIFVAIRTGLRRGELLGLRWKDINFREKTITIRQTLSYTPEKGLFFKTPKTKKSHRTIDISDEVIQVIKLRKKKQLEDKLFHGQAYEDNELVFCQPNGKPMHPDTPTSWFPEFLEKIGLSKLNFHCLRHTHASLLLKAGVDIKIISERLGHSSIRITYDIYSHLMPGMQKEAVDKLENLLK